MQGGGGSLNATCGGQCAGLAATEWLAAIGNGPDNWQVKTAAGATTNLCLSSILMVLRV